MIRALTQLSRLHQCFEVAQGVLEDRLGTPICISCGLCCRGNTPSCMIIEAIYMVSVLTGTGRLKAAIDAAESWLLERPRIAANEMGLSYEGLPVGAVPPGIQREWKQVTRKRCPFLTDKNLCLVHTCRPMVCMAYGVTRDQEGCPRPLGKGETSTHHGTLGAGDIAPAVTRFKREYRQSKPEWTIYGFAPTLLFRAAEPDRFRAMVDDNRIPSAKIIGTEINASLMWQPQVDAVRQGVSPDLVAYAYDTNNPEKLLAGRCS